MVKLELHFIHGFLGMAADWKPVQKFLANPELRFVNHDLNDHFLELKEKNKTQSFSNWALLMNQKLQLTDTPKLVVGYSLGGRLLSHVDSRFYEKRIIIGSHPGLLEHHSERLASDQKWVDLLFKVEMSEWLRQWNSQEIFKADKNRPNRPWTSAHRDLIGETLMSYSLGKQTLRDMDLRNNSVKTYWAIGENDHKFAVLIPRLKKILPERHIWVLPNSGHGLIFSQPQVVAEKIKEVVDDLI